MRLKYIKCRSIHTFSIIFVFRTDPTLWAPTILGGDDWKFISVRIKVHGVMCISFPRWAKTAGSVCEGTLQLQASASRM